ncbi:hypothetical protein [Pseudomonas sp. TSRC2-2]|uniref:hypothetical protein n=1 Tax=Pseudomonas sp. TSRC2-2 TaxID=2804571 RepID=UPI003CE9E8E2
MKLKTPDSDDKSEMAGRMYEACDLRLAIEGGHLKNLEDVLEWAKNAESGLQALMELPEWVINDNSCVDFKASIEHNRRATAAESIVAQASNHVFLGDTRAAKRATALPLIMQFPMQFKNSEGQMIDIDLAKARHMIILGGSVEPLRLDPLEAARSSPEFIVQLLEQYAGVKLNDEKKQLVLSILSGLPEGATMRDLYEAIKVKEAASIGIKPEQYDALAPLFEALCRMQKEGVHVGLFDQRADV